MEESEARSLPPGVEGGQEKNEREATKAKEGCPIASVSPRASRATSLAIAPNFAPLAMASRARRFRVPANLIMPTTNAARTEAEG